MNPGLTLLMTFAVGVTAGLRTFTAPAVVAWAAHRDWLNLFGSHLAFMGSVWTVGFFTIMALVEFVVDQLPTMPARTNTVPLCGRIVMGLLAGACVGTAGGASLLLGALLGAIGAVAGAFGGYKARVGLVRRLRVPDFVIAIPEDLIAIGLGLLVVSRF